MRKMYTCYADRAEAHEFIWGTAVSFQKHLFHTEFMPKAKDTKVKSLLPSCALTQEIFTPSYLRFLYHSAPSLTVRYGVFLDVLLGGGFHWDYAGTILGWLLGGGAC